MFVGAVAVFLAAASFLPCDVSAISAQKALLMDAQTGRILFAKNADEKSLIASTTKIMTALLVCQQCNVLDRVRIPKEAVGIEGSSIYLQEGEILTVQDLLYGMMLHSGNDAAVALAIYCGGTLEGFAQMMNDKAHNLGLENTHFVNPHGLDAPGHYSSAIDLAKLTAYAMKDPIFLQTVSTKTVNAAGRALTNHNKLLWRVKGANGVKTGYTRSAGRILVSGASRCGRQLIAVTIHAPDDWNDHMQLLEQGFSKYTVSSLIRKGDVLGTVQVLEGAQGSVDVIAAEDFRYALAHGEQINVVLPGPGFVFAPIAENSGLGDACILVDGVPVGRIPTVAGDSVELCAEKEKTFWNKLFGG